LNIFQKRNKIKELSKASTFLGHQLPKILLLLKNIVKFFKILLIKKIINHYAPTDEVLNWADKKKYVKGPLGLNGTIGKPISKYHQKLVKPKNHRFASYAAVLNSFP